MSVLRPFLIALQFLTVLPIRTAGAPDAAATGRSLLYYPLVGLVLGLLLTALAWLLADAPSPLAAALLLAFWIALTGALHLDGLADTLDAWLGGLGDREQTLAIMKDPCCGPAGVVALVLVLLLKFAALAELADADVLWAVAASPVLGRTALPLLFLTTPYLRPRGLGTALAAHLPRRAAVTVVIGVALAFGALAGTDGLLVLLTGAAVFLLLRSAMLRRIGGTTGDTAGALVELTEAATLVAVVLTSVPAP